MKHFYELSNGVKIPNVGFGTWQTPDGDVCYNAVKHALDTGYRHIDTAAIYGNEQSVGQAIADSEIPRDALFITTKLWNSEHTYDKTLAAFDASMEKLGLEYLDLYLIHWPNPLMYREDWKKANAETWRAMETLYTSGKVRAIGVSNFMPHHLEALLETATVKPMVNQIYVNPSDMQRDVVQFNEAHGILTEAYSPLGTGTIFEVPLLKDLAEKYNRSIAQIVLRWSLDHGFLPLPKSVTNHRIEENFDIYDFELSEFDRVLIDELQGSAKMSLDPDSIDF